MSDLIENSTKDIQKVVENEEDKLDEHGRLIHDDFINFKIEHNDLLLVHKTLRTVMHKGLVPDPDVGPLLTLLELLAEREKAVHDEGFLFLPVNYFVGMWHGMNTGRKFSVIEDKKKSKHLDYLTKKVAEEVDKYHSVKSHESHESALNLTPDYFGVGAQKLIKE